MVTTIPSTKNSQPQPLIWTPAIAVHTLIAYQSETKNRPNRIASASQPAAESGGFGSLPGGVSI